MSERNGAYEHTTETTGTSDGDTAATEHREPARGGAQQRNELAPEQRGRGDGHGPRTHDDTRTVRRGRTD